MSLSKSNHDAFNSTTFDMAEKPSSGKSDEASDPSVVHMQTADLFGAEEGDVDFRGMSWLAAAVVIAKLQIGLGALSLPSTFHTLGFFGGIFCFVVLSILTGIAGYVSGNARLYYPTIHSVADAAEILFGRSAREVVGILYYIFLAMIAGAGMLTTSVALNALSDHGACTMAFVAVACVAAFIIGTSFRSLEKVAWVSWVGVAAIVVAIWTTAIACLVGGRPAAAPAVGPYDLDIRVFPGSVSFAAAMTAISGQLFAVGASGAFFSVAAEMKEPHKFTRALIVGQLFIVLTCIAIASMVYGKVGQYLASPALGSAGPLMKKVAYGLALPGLLVTAVLYSHIAAKYWFVRILRGTRHLQSNTTKHWTTWIGSMLVTVVFGFIVVGVVPFFGDFLSLVGALIMPVFTNIMPGFMIMFYVVRRPVKTIDGQHITVQENSRQEGGRHWMWDSFKIFQGNWKETLALFVGWFMVLSGIFIIIGGTYGTVLSIKASYDEGTVGGVFSCADNSV